MEPSTYTFTEDQLDALDALLDLVHYDDLAKKWFEMLPQSLKVDLGVAHLEKEDDA